jgi:tetratricopeptide (TPR) repeat protein
MQFERFLEKAFEHRQHLPGWERYFIEGEYYTKRQETYAQAISAFKKSVELNPDDLDARHELAWTYLAMERFDEADEHLEILIRRETPDYTSYSVYARCNAFQGRFEKGYDAIRGYVELNPENARGYLLLSQHLIRWGKLDEAIEALEKAISLGEQQHLVDNELWLVVALREQWEEAEASVQRTMASKEPVNRLQGAIRIALTHLFHGRTKEGLGLLEQAKDDYAEPDVNRAKADIYAACIALERGQAAQALEKARAAQKEGKGDPPEWEGLFFAALAQATQGNWAEAERTAEELERRTESLPTEKEKRRYHHLRGEIALLRNDSERATAELEQAQSMLPARGFPQLRTLPQHVPIWYSLASAYMASGDEDSASKWFQRIADSTTEHVDWPIPYVRSFYFLGKIHENQGDMEKAREHYHRFYEYWKDGDMDRERLEEARRKLAS